MFKKRWLVPFLSALIVMVVLVTIASFLYRFPPAKSPSPTATATACATSQPGSGSPIRSICLKRILVFSKTAAFRHASIPDGKQALKNLAQQHSFAIDFSEDANVFTASNLARYSVVVFLLTTGEIFNNSQQAAFQQYIEAGGGFVGIHSASDTEYDWPWYDGLVGAHNNIHDKHSSVQQATVYVEDPNTPSTNMLPVLWVRTDEWYNFALNPRSRVHVLLTVDEKTYKGGIMGADHPIAWYHAYDGGRAWYTAMGHTSESYHEPLFLAHLWGGILYASGLG
ncbi:MAG TPA: ThuA domain-containing protein [Ktedonobacteraceae bacterium]|nr:ThuA domain-containing protein [Ktedonobacteraceae bacterium]